MVFKIEDPFDGRSVTDASTSSSWAILNPVTASLAHTDKAASLSTTGTDALPAPYGAATAPIQPLSSDQDAAVTKYREDFKCVDSRVKGNMMPEIQIKDFMLGDYSVSMSVLPRRFMQDAWMDDINLSKYEGPGWTMTKVFSDRQIRLEMLVERLSPQCSVEAWPTGTPHFYSSGRHCEACMLVYDVNSRESFEAVKTFYRKFCQERIQESSYCPECGTVCSPRPPFQGLVFAFANKTIYDNAKWQVSIKEGQEFSSSIGPFAEFVPMSVKMGQGCRSPDVQDMIKQILLLRTQDPPFYDERVFRIERRLRSYGKPATRPLHPYYDSQLYWY